MTYKITYNIRVGKKRFYHLTLFENETPTITHHPSSIRAQILIIKLVKILYKRLFYNRLFSNKNILARNNQF